MKGIFGLRLLGAVSWSVLAIFSSAGCGFSSGKVVSAHITGYVTMSVAGGYVFKDMTEVVPGGIPLALDEPFTTYDWVVLRIVQANSTGKDSDFKVLFGPYSSGGIPAEAEVRAGDGFFLSAGWALLDGRCPIANTARTWAGADGTRFLLEIAASGSTFVDRIHLLDLTAASLGGGPAHRVHVRDSILTCEYITRVHNYVLNPPLTPETAMTSAMRTLAAQCEAVATAAGW